MCVKKTIDSFRSVLAGGCFLFILASPSLFAAGTSGADVLRLKLDARAWSLGRSGTSLLDLSGTSGYNPAALGFSGRQTLSFIHFFAFPDIACEQFVFRRPVKSLGTFAGELLHRHQEPIDNVSGEIPFHVSDTILGVYFGRNHNEVLFYGLGLKGIILRLGDSYAYGLATDLGAIYRLPKMFDVGFSLRNIGPGVKFLDAADPLPWEVNCGVSRGLELFAGQGSVTFLTDMSVNREGELGLSLGAEAGSKGSWMVRTGYRLERRGRSLAEGPSVGFGLSRDFKVFQLEVDYCCKFILFELGGYDYQPEHLLGFTVLISPPQAAVVAPEGDVVIEEDDDLSEGSEPKPITPVTP